MKILYITTVPVEKNGITNVIFNLLGAMDCSELKADLVCKREPEPYYKKRIEEYGGSVFVIPRNKNHIIRYIRSLSRLIKNNKYDICHIHGNSYTMAFELIAAKLGGCKIRITHAHSTTCKHEFINKILKPFFYMNYTNGLACGLDSGRFLYGRKPFCVINNGVDTEKYKFSAVNREIKRNELKIKDEILIGHVGAFDDFKNQSFLIEIFSALINKSDSYRLLLIGDGEHKKEVEEKATKYGVGDFTIFLGTSNEVEKYLSACDAIVMPSLYEGLPLSLIEEQANGLSCFCADTITKEADKTGNLFFYSLDDSPDFWAHRIVDNIDSSINRDDISEFAVRKIIDSGYSIYDEAAKLKRMYDKLLLMDVKK